MVSRSERAISVLCPAPPLTVQKQTLLDSVDLSHCAPLRLLCRQTGEQSRASSSPPRTLRLLQHLLDGVAAIERKAIVVTGVCWPVHESARSGGDGRLNAPFAAHDHQPDLVLRVRPAFGAKDPEH